MAQNYSSDNVTSIALGHNIPVDYWAEPILAALKNTPICQMY